MTLKVNLILLFSNYINIKINTKFNLWYWIRAGSQSCVDNEHKLCENAIL